MHSHSHTYVPNQLSNSRGPKAKDICLITSFRIRGLLLGAMVKALPVQRENAGSRMESSHFVQEVGC